MDDTPQQPPVQIEESALTEAERLNISYPPENSAVLNVLNEPTGETVVYDRDDEGNILGWHKEITNG